MRTVVLFLNDMEKQPEFRYTSVTANSSYEIGKAYEYLKWKNQMPNIKFQTYKKWKKRSFKPDISKCENIDYDAENDTYHCHA